MLTAEMISQGITDIAELRIEASGELTAVPMVPPAEPLHGVEGMSVDGGANLPLHEAEAPVTPPAQPAVAPRAAEPRPPYTNPEQLSPHMRPLRVGQRRLRFARLGRAQRGWTVWDITTQSAEKVVTEMSEPGLFPKMQIPDCPDCLSRRTRRTPAAVDLTPGNLGWRCRCGRRTLSACRKQLGPALLAPKRRP